MDGNYHHERAYKNSKLAQFWVQRAWEEAYGQRGIHTDVVCPGFVPVTAAEHVHGPMHFLMRHVMPHMPFASSRDAARAPDPARAFGAGARGLGRHDDASS